MDETKIEYRCPWCLRWIEKRIFSIHTKEFHRNDPDILKHPDTLQELHDRFVYLGMYEER